MAADLLYVLTWTDDVDLDFAVTEPGGFEIWYGSGPSPAGGVHSGDSVVAGEERISWPVGQTPEGETFIANVRYVNWNSIATDASYTLQVFRGGVLYQEEIDTITEADRLIGARLDYRDYELCGNATGGDAAAAAVGVIEMGGGGSGDGETCVLPNDPPGPCWTYGWTWSGNSDTPSSDSLFGPGGYDPDGTTNQTLTPESVNPPGQVWGCDDTRYSEVVMADVSSLWAHVLTQIGSPSDGTCTATYTATASWAGPGVTVNILAQRTLESLTLGCRNFAPYDVTDRVVIGIGYFDGTVSLVDWTSVTTQIPDAAAHLALDLGAAAQLGSQDGVTYWRTGIGNDGFRSHVIDDIYAIFGGGIQVSDGEIGDVFASGEVQQDGG